jgi:hypothetical protein
MTSPQEPAPDTDTDLTPGDVTQSPREPDDEHAPADPARISDAHPANSGEDD